MLERIKKTIFLNGQILIFCFKTLFYTLSFYLTIRLFIQKISPFINRITALSAKYLLLILKQKVSIVDSTIIGDNFFQLVIIDECTAIFEMLVFSAGILAFPTTGKNRLRGIFYGNIAIYILNIFRIVVMYFISSLFPSVFEFIHLYLWNILFTIGVITIWAVWFEILVKPQTQIKFTRR